ncbi:MAG: hypothetical protein HYT90_01600 [Candidatus Omnitrophica bacterium]|nr:hypothetical protein [Candidatus Omnitrophota bacterium]
MRAPRTDLGYWLTIAVLAFPAAACAESDSKTVRVSCTILPRLELSVTPETGESIAFGAIEQPAPGETTVRSTAVKLNVFSNMGRPYHVTQMVRKPLATPEGAAIPDDQFRVLTQDAARGRMGAPQPTPLAAGVPTTLYTSDERGKSDAFSARYTLTVTPDTPAGEFDTEIVYTVTSL